MNPRSVNVRLLLVLAALFLGMHLMMARPADEKVFDRQWKRVDSLEKAGLPRSALELVNAIGDQARQQKNEPQLVKSVIWKLKLEAQFHENFSAFAVGLLQSEIAASEQPLTSLFHSLLGEIYWNYYNQNAFRLSGRSVVTGAQSDSIQTWDPARIVSEANREYLLSLNQANALQAVAASKFAVIMESKSGEENARAIDPSLRPTLYDFLIQRALEYFTTSARNLSADRDTLSKQDISLTLFKEATAFHANDADPRVFISYELQRLSFIHDHSGLGGNDSIYANALVQLEQKYQSSPASADVSFARAQYLTQSASQYAPLVSPDHKWDLKEALAICEQAIKRHPGSEGAGNCSELAAEIRKPSLNVSTGYAVYPGKEFPLLVEFSNVTELWFRLVSIDPEEFRLQTANRDREKVLNYLYGKYFTKAWSQKLPSDGDYQKHSAEISTPGVSPGFYILVASADPTFSDVNAVASYHALWATQLSYISQRNEDGGYDIYVLERETGKALKDVAVESYTRNYNYMSREWAITKTGDFITDENGFFRLADPGGKGSNQSLFLKLKYKNDLFTTPDLYVYPGSKTPVKPLLQTNFYTDRAIYRPGQTIWFKGIVLEKTGDDYALKSGYTTTVTFRDVNYQEIGKTTFTSSEFGSFNGSFTIPTGLLNGIMTISNENGSVSISVEEYRRPTFEVTFAPVEGNYKLSEQVTVTGKAAAFAGNDIAGASVSWRVVRTARFPYFDWAWFRPFPVSQETEILNGTAKTAPDGTFSITFPAVPDLTVPRPDQPVFDFAVYADVTDINGEMQSGSQTVSAGYTALVLGSTLPGQVNLNRDSVFTVMSTNAGGRKTPCEVRVTLKRLKQPDRPYIPRLWDRPDLSVMTRDEFHSEFPYDIYMNENDPSTWPVEHAVFEKSVNTGIDSVISLIDAGGKKQGAGTYQLTLSAVDPFGEKVERISYFTFFDPDSKEMPVRVMNWFVPLKARGEPGEKASFLVGSSEDDVNMIFEVRVHDSLYSRKWIRISDRQMIVDVPILDGFRGNFSVNFTFVKHNRVFQNSQVVTVPWTNKKLDIAIETFRDKLIPGTQEEWKVRITGPDKQAAEAEFMVGMYDASLDVFRQNEWYFNILPYYSGMEPWGSYDNFRSVGGAYYPLSWTGPHYKFRDTDRLNWFGNAYLGGGPGFRGRYPAMDMGERPMMMDKMTNTMAREESPPAPEATAATVPEAEGKPAETPSQFQVRRDFRETAFFYPTLVTDSTGSLILKFTVPESLTRWNLMGLAYAKDLKYGMIEKTTVTRKDIMVIPNPPRFVRQGDTLVFTAKVVSLSDADQTGIVSLILTDPVTNRSLNSWIQGGNPQQLNRTAVTLPKGGSASLSWKIVIPAEGPASLLQYRITATAGTFSDGEEKILPVLPNRMMVTETMPLPVRGKGIFQFRFDQFSSAETEGPSLKNYRLTLEFTGHPAWYAIQALPAMSEVTYPSADNLFDAWYSNALASHIANSDPAVRRVFESWKQLTPNALVSNLEKNEDLKTALLQETPWVLEAKEESANKRKIGLYFDRNNLENNLEQNLDLLNKLQLPSGGWAWFEGMPENRWVTQEIMTGFGRLHHLGVTDITGNLKTLSMLESMLGYLDSELVKDYENIKKYYPGKMDDNHLSAIQVHYLYARSFFNSQFPVHSSQPNDERGVQSAEFQQAWQYFSDQAARYWLSQDLSVQAMIALALDRLGDTKTPAAILRSLKEKALHSSELGMYWAVSPGYLWSQAPVETQAMLIEAFQEAGQDQKSVDDMNVWLLKQKQTQMWKSRRATADACYALLLRGTDQLATDPGIKIRIGSQEIDPSSLNDHQAEAGTGYFRVTWNGSEITPDLANITVTKSTEGIAWGGLYWQYFENLDKITQQQTPLKVKREIYVQKNTGKGPAMEKIPDSGCRMGDKITVRIILTVDRDMEFVHMKDMRAAGFEPLLTTSPPHHLTTYSEEGLSGYRYQDGLGYYQSIGDLGANFFFDRLPKGTYVFEYPLKVNNAGDFSNGITTVQCLYAPEFSAHSEGVRVVVK